MGKNEPERNQDGEDRYGLKRKIKKIVFVVVVDLFFRPVLDAIHGTYGTF